MNTAYKNLYDTHLSIKSQAQAQGKSGSWHNARPLQYDGGILLQLKRAWDVFRGEADALYWTIDLDK